jgi:hypothetical protein
MPTPVPQRKIDFFHYSILFSKKEEKNKKISKKVCSTPFHF